MNNNLKNNLYRVVCNNNLINKSRINYIKKKVRLDGLYICKLNYFEIEELSTRNYMCTATRSNKFIVEKMEV